jgi:spore coat polysaccharide biosynthesis protein SpsF
MKTVAVIQARYTSTRLPGKVLMDLAGKPVLGHIIERLSVVDSIDEICLSVPDGDGQQPLLEFADTVDGLSVSRGPVEDLISRFANAVDITNATAVVRAWADCPAVNPTSTAALIAAFHNESVAYAEIPGDSGYPEGFEVHILSAELIKTVDAGATDPKDRELIIPYLTRYPNQFPCLRLSRTPSHTDIKLLLDTPKDYEKLKKVFEALYPKNPLFGLTEVEAYAKNHDVT